MEQTIQHHLHPNLQVHSLNQLYENSHTLQKAYKTFEEQYQSMKCQPSGTKTIPNFSIHVFRSLIHEKMSGFYSKNVR